MEIKQVATVPLATTEEVLRINVGSFSELGLHIKNTGANPLDAFEVYVTFSGHSGSPEQLIASIAGDFTSPAWPIRRATSPVTLAANGTAYLFMNTLALYEVIVKASAGTGASQLTFHGHTL